MNTKTKSKFLTKGIILLLTLVMTVAMVFAGTVSASAAEATYDYSVGNTASVEGDDTAMPTGTIPPSTHWEGPVKSASVTCGKEEHTHTDDCYNIPNALECKHFWESTLLGHPDTCTIADMSNPCTKKICFSSHKTVDGTKYHVKFECQHTHTRDCYTLGCSNSISGEHTHSDVSCYSFTWTLAYNVYNTTITTNKDGVVASNYATTIQHGDNLTFDLPAMNDIGWVATVYDNGAVKGSYALNADVPTTITVENVASGNITVELAKKTIYNVTLVNTTPDFGSASIDVERAVSGTTVTVTATPTANTANTKYALTSITVNGVAISGNTFTVGEANAEVVVTFSKASLVANSSATIEFNPSKTAAQQLDALKQEIFNKLAVSYLPGGVTYDQVTYEHLYYQTWDVGGQVPVPSQSDEYTTLGTDPADKDVTLGYYTTHPFGYTGIGTVEHVRITYNGLVIEADVTLTHTHVPGTEADCVNDQLCTVCGGVVVAAYGHTDGEAVTENYVAETCEANGSYDTVTYCTVCKAETSRVNTVIDELDGHVKANEAVIENQVGGSCVEPGSYDLVFYCTNPNCDYEFSRETFEVSVNHTPGAAVKENKVAPTCTEYGSYDLAYYCVVDGCGEEIIRFTYYVNPKGHGNGEYMYVNNNDGTHNNVCNECGEVESVVAHAFDNYVCVCGAIEAFTVTFKYYGGEASYSVEYGTVPTAPAEVIVPAYHTFEGWDNEVVAVSGATTYNAVYTLNATSGTITINKYYSDKTVLENLRNKVLEAAGLPTDGNYTVATKTSVNVLITTVDIWVNITDAGVTFAVDNSVSGIIKNAIEKLDLASLLATEIHDDASRPFRITDNDTGVSKEISMQITDSRQNAVVVLNKINGYTLGTNIDHILDIVKENITVTPVYSNVIVTWGEDYSNTVFENGTTVTLKVIVDVVILADYQDQYVGVKQEFDISVYVPYTSASITIKQEADLAYNNTIMTDKDTMDKIIAVVSPEVIPGTIDDYDVVVWYMASEARSYDMVINFNYMDLGIYGSIIKRLLGDSVTIQIPVEEMWLNIGDDLTVPAAPSNEFVQHILLNDFIPNYGEAFLKGNLSSDQMSVILQDILRGYPEISEYYMYKDAHKFGENNKEIVRLNIENNEYGVAISNSCVINVLPDGNAHTYRIFWDTDGDGIVDVVTEVARGEMPIPPECAKFENKSFAGWSPEIKAVDGKITYTATYTQDTLYYVVFTVNGMDFWNVQSINLTKNPDATIVDPGVPVKENSVFVGWDRNVIGTVPNENMVVSAVWLERGTFVPKTSITLAAALIYNVYVPVCDEVKSFVLDGVIYTDMSSIVDKIVVVDGKEYYVFAIELPSADAGRDVVLEVVMSISGNDYSGTWTMSVPKYAKKVIELEGSTTFEKQLAKDVLAYVKAAYNYFADYNTEEEIARVNALVDSIIGADYTSVPVSSGATNTIAPVTSVTLVLEAKPAIRFYVTDTNVKFYANGKKLNTVSGEDENGAYVEIGVYAYALCETITYGNGGSYHVSSFVEGAVETDYEALVKAFVKYTESAKKYRDEAIGN